MKSTLSKACICVLLTFISASLCVRDARGQDSSALQDRITKLSQAVDRVQAEIDSSQRQLAELRKQLADLQSSSPHSTAATPDDHPEARHLADAVAALSETQSMQQTQIATLQQSKVESDSKYPVKINGLILMSSVVSTRRVDTAQTPTVAFDGGGSTSATMRQTTLGVDARGPHVFGAETRASLRLDFDASAPSTTYAGATSLGIARLRTANAELAWRQTRAFFAFDRPIISPERPTSLLAVSTPALAWSGNLWAWNPEFGLEHDWFSYRPLHLRTQLALLDVADSPALYSTSQSRSYTPPSTAELSRWPGVEARIAIVRDNDPDALQLGVGGHYAPHRTSTGSTFNSWAVSADMHLPLTRYATISASAYDGQALGGLGEGAFKDYVARLQGGELYHRTLDDLGGWLQLKERLSNRLEFNQAFGVDNVPASQLRPYAVTAPVNLYNLARNRTLTGNVVYSPSAYFLFSLEYRRIASSYVTNPTLFSDIIGLAAGYRF